MEIVSLIITFRNYSRLAEVKPNYKAVEIKAADGIDTYAYGLHDLISTECPGAVKDKSILQKGCITVARVLKRLRQQHFTSLCGVKYNFDKNGDMLSDYLIKQYTWKNTKGNTIMGTYSKVTGILQKTLKRIYL